MVVRTELTLYARFWHVLSASSAYSAKVDTEFANRIRAKLLVRSIFLWLTGFHLAGKCSSCWDQAKGPASLPGLSYLTSSERLDLEIHTTHAAHAATARRHAASTCVLLRNFSHHSFVGDQQSR